MLRSLARKKIPQKESPLRYGELGDHARDIPKNRGSI